MTMYDVAVLGGGPGGYVAAIRTAKLGQKTVLIEQKDMGGTCLNRGCIPTKSLLESAHLYHSMLHAENMGVLADNIRFDYAGIAKRKQAVVKRLRGGVEHLLKSAGVTVINGKGEPAGERKIAVNGSVIEARNVILATGSVPVRLPIPGADLPGVLDSDGVLALETCPPSVVIVGGGVIGMEFAALYAALGVPVTVLEVMETILTGLDDDVISTIRKSIMKQGVQIKTGSRVTQITGGGEKTVHYEHSGKPFSIQAGLVIMAAGRRPVTETAEAWGIKTERNGIVVDEYMRTNVPGVYAIGDCTGKVQLAHVASAQGLIAAGHAAGVSTEPMRYDVVPACVYTDPEIACVGLTEAAAKATGRSIKCGSFPVAANGRSMVMDQGEGFCKIITDERSGEILGAHIVAPRATDMIAEVAALMRCEGTIEELSGTIHPHPTVSEIIMEAAHDVEGLCGHKP